MSAMWTVIIMILATGEMEREFAIWNIIRFQIANSRSNLSVGKKK